MFGFSMCDVGHGRLGDVTYPITSPEPFLIDNKSVYEEHCISATLDAQNMYDYCAALVVEPGMM